MGDRDRDEERAEERASEPEWTPPALATHWQIKQIDESNGRQGPALVWEYGTPPDTVNVNQFPVCQFSPEEIARRWGGGIYRVIWSEYLPDRRRYAMRGHTPTFMVEAPPKAYATALGDGFAPPPPPPPPPVAGPAAEFAPIHAFGSVAAPAVAAAAAPVAIAPPIEDRALSIAMALLQQHHHGVAQTVTVLDALYRADADRRENNFRTSLAQQAEHHRVMLELLARAQHQAPPVTAEQIAAAVAERLDPGSDGDSPSPGLEAPQPPSLPTAPVETAPLPTSPTLLGDVAALITSIGTTLDKMPAPLRDAIGSVLASKVAPPPPAAALPPPPGAYAS